MNTQDNILHTVYGIRGRVIQIAVELETLIDIYISERFTHDVNKRRELIALILSPRITLDNKFQVFTYLVNQYNPEFKKEYPNFTKAIKYIIEERNVFAHYPVDFSKESIEAYEKSGVINLVLLKASSEYGLAGKRELNEEYVNGMLNIMTQYINALKKLVGGLEI